MTEIEAKEFVRHYETHAWVFAIGMDSNEATCFVGGESWRQAREQARLDQNYAACTRTMRVLGNGATELVFS